MIQLHVGKRGEIVIPKKIRESLGIKKENNIFLEIKADAIELRALPKKNEDIMAKWAAQAKKENVNISKWKMGNELYEEVF